MLFNSLHYLIFFPIVIALYFAVQKSWRWVLLLAASYYFYMSWKAEYALILLLSTGIDFWAGLQMSKRKSRRERLPFLIMSLCSNLGLLFFFKYFNFFSINIHELLGLVGVAYKPPLYYIILPLGISFYTFQTLSYSIDLYKGNIKPETHFGYFALYVSFFPQLIAGPIERSSHLIPQLKKKIELKADDVRYGLNKITLGFFKKLVIADSVSIFTDFVFLDLSTSNGTQVLLASLLFGVQLFCDFSGYTDIAIGSARLLGINLIENFNRPFWTRNFREFWSRWHMSLTQWIFIYMQYPLLGDRPGVAKRFLVNLFVLIVIGFWHGATWNFIFFGFYHGMIMGIQGLLEATPWIPTIKYRIYTHFLQPVWNAFLVSLSTLMFRSTSIEQTFTGFKLIFTDFRLSFEHAVVGFTAGTTFWLMLVMVLLLIPTAFFNRELKFRSNLAYLIIIFFIIIFFGQDASQQFIYFQF
jgi:D-alanyl-lipoteichoic acid acyltransferase DltB (MBOAT superfamily)